MTEDAERLDDSVDEVETSETDVEVEEPEKKQETKVKKEKKPRTNPLGLVFNIRMFRRFIQIGFFLAINAYIFAAWFGFPSITIFAFIELTS